MKQVPLKTIMPVPEAETANELMAVAADRVWVLKSQSAPHIEHEPSEPLFFYSRNLHDLMSKGVSSNNEYSISYVKATSLHNHWFMLMNMLDELEPLQPWRTWSCSVNTLHLISNNLREWHGILIEANLAPLVVEQLQIAVELTQNILEELT